MQTPVPDLPPPKVLHALLRKLTERLATELAQPSSQSPDWSEFEWRLARGVAAMHGVSPLLARALKWQGPPHWQQFLEEQRAHVVARHRRIEDLLAQLDARARDESVALVGLKGTALHAMGLYRRGERPMADVDLLVHPRDAQRAGQVLESLGFSELLSNWRHQVFVPAVREVHTGLGEHAQNYLKIELHQRIAEELPLRLTDVTDKIMPRQSHPGMNGYPSRAALLIHLLIHAANGMAYRALRLMHLNDIALLCSRLSESDWIEFLEHRREGGSLWWALPPLQLVARYYERAVPADVLTTLANDCQWSLRHVARRQSLSDVSMSYPWIEAFPGIEWCRSMAEMLEYMASRIRPSAETLRLRKVVEKTQVAISKTDWNRLSQGRRMLKWVMSRQTRPDTLHAVRTAAQ